MVDKRFFCATLLLDKGVGMVEIIPNYEIAKVNMFPRGFSSGGFSMYSAAYVITNENLRRSMQYVPKKCDNALVVAASGDHPLFCSLYGAKHVDTFDISYNAKCIMDIKVAALQILSKAEYWKLLCDLYRSYDIIEVKNMARISDLLSPVVFDYLWAMSRNPIFTNGCAPICNKDYALTVREYNELRKIVKKPFNFILSDVSQLWFKLPNKYDFIHLSNIFDYCPQEKRKDIILSLLSYVNVGGIILMHDQLKCGTTNACMQIASEYNNLVYHNRGCSINTLTRVR